MKRIPILGFVLLCMSALAAQAIINPSQTSCKHGREIELLIRGALRESGIAEIPATEETWCASAAALPEHASLEIARMRRDVLLHAVEFRLRCKSGGDCLPFLVRLPFPEGSSGKRDVTPGNMPQRAEKMRSDFLVRPGQIVTLIWSEKGMHIERRVVCLDAGRAGERVRTRIQPGGKMVPARVSAAGLLEAGL